MSRIIVTGMLRRFNFQIEFLRQDVADGNVISPRQIESLQQTHDGLVERLTDREAVEVDTGYMLGVVNES